MRPILLAASGYCMYNCAIVKLTGEIIYSFYPWTSLLRGVRDVAATLSAICVVQTGFNKIDEALKPELKQKRDYMSLY